MKQKLFQKLIIHFCVLLVFCTPLGIVFGAESQVLSVTPPLFQLSAKLGDIWQSSVKVVNSNSYPLTVYAEVVNFKATGEAGQGTFVPIMERDTDQSTLAQWIHIRKGPHTIAPEQTVDISFFAEIPKDAPPGGHYAAVLISTEPPKDGEQSFALQTTQTVTSLFFVRIEGDVHEIGSIREFRTTDAFVPRPETGFSLRFENKGNVHLQPRGNIIITNMWGTERGVIPINYQTHFGNVLPQSIRDFKFVWQSDFSITDVGRYKAVVTLAYGEDGVKSVSSATYFWVIPVKVTLITITIIATSIFLIVLMIRAYVRRMLVLAGVNPTRMHVMQSEDEALKKASSASGRYQKVSAPLRRGVLDLRSKLDTVDETIDIVKAIMQFIVQYRLFFISVAILVAIFVSSVMYIGKATEERSNYRVIIDEGDGTTTLEGVDIEKSARTD